LSSCIAVSWDGFTDPESDIWGYTFAVGRNVCGSDVTGGFRDPQPDNPHPDPWTVTGIAKDVEMEDGDYYVTVQALNNVVFGGALVTTVCLSVPFRVDTTPPVIHEVQLMMFDEDFDILSVYYNASDPESDIAYVDIGFGRTSHDVMIRHYARHVHIERENPYVAVENLKLQEGLVTWIRLRVVNGGM
jgi:hypothetical protein